MWHFVSDWYSYICLSLQKYTPLLLVFIVILVIVIIHLKLRQCTLKKTEYLLSSLRDKYNIIVANTSDIIWEIDTDLKFVFTNERIKDILGYSSEDLKGVTYESMFAISDTESASTIFNSFVDHREPFFNIEARFCSIKGEDVILIVTGFPLFDEKGQLYGYSGLCSDVTKQRHDKHVLQEMESRFEQVFRYSPSSVTISMLDSGAYVDVNKSFENLTGYSHDEVIGRSAVDLGIINTQSRELIVNCFKKDGFVDNEEITIIRKDGKERIGLFSGVFIYIDGKLALLATTIDISDKKKLEKNFRQRIEEQQILVDNTELLIWQLRDPKTYGIVNDAYARFFGIDKDEIEGKSLYDVLLLEEAKELHKFSTESFVRSSSTKDMFLTNSSNGKRLLSICCSPKLDMDGEVQYVVCFARDITGNGDAGI